MIKIENYEVIGWEHAIRGMRNPMNSWEKSDSIFCKRTECSACEFKDDCKKETLDYDIGINDHELMTKLAKAGSVHAKYRRMITVYVDITAPLYFWKEFDTYKVGTVANSCSTMHKIADKEFTIDDFSIDHLMLDRIVYSDSHLADCKNYEELMREGYHDEDFLTSSLGVLGITIDALNLYRKLYLQTKDKQYWWQMIQLLPSSYNQKRTIMLNYEVLANIYEYRRNHKLDEWYYLCNWIESLPYSEIITCLAK